VYMQHDFEDILDSIFIFSQRLTAQVPSMYCV